MAYTLFKAFMDLPMGLFRIGYWVMKVEKLFSLFLSHLYTGSFALAQYIFRRTVDEQDNTLRYFTQWSNLLIIVAICITYSVMSPVIIVFTAIYIIISQIIFTYQAVMCFIPENESGGASMFVAAFNRLCISFYIAIITMIVLMLVKQAFYCGVCLVPLFLLIWIGKASLNKKFGGVFASSDSWAAGIMDAKAAREGMEKEKEKEKEKDDEKVEDVTLQFIPEVLKAEWQEDGEPMEDVGAKEVEIVEVDEENEKSQSGDGE